MTISEYLNTVKVHLLANAIVVNFQIKRERQTLVDGHIRARLVLIDGSTLEFSEYVKQSADEKIEIITYSYHWADKQDHLIRRWDNAPHFPGIAGFPHHIHEGENNLVRHGAPVDVFEVLRLIGQNLINS